MVTRLVTSTTYLIAAVLIVFSLAVSEPASCWCPRGDHAGMLLHLLFPHHHGDAHPAYDEDFPPPAASDAERANASVAPALTGPQADASSGGVGGAEILLALFMAAALAVSAPWRLVHTVGWDQHRASPLTPPPRYAIVAR